MSLEHIIANYIAQQHSLGKRYSAEVTILAAFRRSISDVRLEGAQLRYVLTEQDGGMSLVRRAVPASLQGDWGDLAYTMDKRGRERVVRMIYRQARVAGVAGDQLECVQHRPVRGVVGAELEH